MPAVAQPLNRPTSATPASSVLEAFMTASFGRDFLGRQDGRGARAMPDASGGFASGFSRRELRRYVGYPVAPSYRNKTGITCRATQMRPSGIASLSRDPTRPR